MKEKLAGFFSWASDESRDFVRNVMRDLKSLKALWNYIFLSLYTWVVVWLVLHHGETCGNAAIYTTGGIVTAVLTNYVWASLAEKKMVGKFPAYEPIPGSTPPKPGSESGPEDGNG